MRGGTGANQHNMQMGHFAPSAESKNRTSETIAAQYKLNEKTVRRYGKEAALIDQHPEMAEAIMKRAAGGDRGNQYTGGKVAVKVYRPEAADSIHQTANKLAGKIVGVSVSLTPLR